MTKCSHRRLPKRGCRCPGGDCCAAHPLVRVTFSGFAGTAGCLSCANFNTSILLECFDEIFCVDLGECGSIDTSFPNNWRGHTLRARRDRCLIDIWLTDMISDPPGSGGAKYGHTRAWHLDLSTDWPGVTRAADEEYCRVYTRVAGHPDCAAGIGLPCSTLPSLDACSTVPTINLADEP